MYAFIFGKSASGSIPADYRLLAACCPALEVLSVIAYNGLRSAGGSWLTPACCIVWSPDALLLKWTLTMAQC